MPYCAAKSDRLKQAKAEAEKEIEAYKQDRENAYQQKQSAVSTGIVCMALECDQSENISDKI